MFVTSIDHHPVTPGVENVTFGDIPVGRGEFHVKVDSFQLLAT